MHSEFKARLDGISIGEFYHMNYLHRCANDAYAAGDVVEEARLRQAYTEHKASITARRQASQLSAALALSTHGTPAPQHPSKARLRGVPRRRS